MSTTKSKKKVTHEARRRTTKRSPARRLYVVDVHGKRQEVVGATGVVIRHGDVEVEVSFPEHFPLADEFAASLSAKNHLLILGPGHGNLVLVRATRL